MSFVLDPQDVSEIVVPRNEKGVVKRLSRRHHELAKLLASGIEPGVAATMMHYDYSRVSILKSDPAFQALIELYSHQVDVAFIDAHKKMALLQETVTEEIQSRIEETPDEFSSSQLTELLKVTSDRSGLGPTSTVRNVNVSLTPSELAAIKDRAAASQIGSVKQISSQRKAEPLGGGPVIDHDSEVRVEAKESDTKSGIAVSANSNENDTSSAPNSRDQL